MNNKECSIFSKANLANKAHEKLHITKTNAQSFTKEELCAALDTCTGDGWVFPDSTFEMKLDKSSGTLYLLPAGGPLSYKDYEILAKGSPQSKIHAIATKKMKIKVDKKEKIGEMLSMIKDKLIKMKKSLDPIKIKIPSTSKNNSMSMSNNMSINNNRNNNMSINNNGNKHVHQ